MKSISAYIILALFATSVFLTLLYFDHTRIVPSYIEQQIQHIKGAQVTFDEPIDVGSGLLVYVAGRILHTNDFDTFKLVQLIFLIGYLCTLYAITLSIKLTLLSVSYAPLLIDSFQAYTAISICLYALALFFILQKKHVAGFALATPLMLVSQESFVFYVGVLLYYFFAEHSYKNFTSLISYSKKHAPLIALLITAVCVYLYSQYAFYGSPFANYIYNQTNPKTFEFPLTVYIVRVAIFFCIFATSLVLYRFNKLLFLINSLFFATYLYFAIFGYDYLFIAIQRFYSGLIMYSIIAIGFYLNIPMRRVRPETITT
ncbi:MAG TPA: hypothetical protein VLG69_00340 [Candidatus Andersenbacteria bacterium]|nr:hypothetical protein [Candidatus Andersenbacteria bacterium]